MAKATQKDPQQEKRFAIGAIRQMVTLATSGFGLVSALAWNNVIQEFVNEYVKIWLPQGSGILSLILYAVLITVLAVFVTTQLSTLLQELENK